MDKRTGELFDREYLDRQISRSTIKIFRISSSSCSICLFFTIPSIRIFTLSTPKLMQSMLSSHRFIWSLVNLTQCLGYAKFYFSTPISALTAGSSITLFTLFSSSLYSMGEMSQFLGYLTFKIWNYRFCVDHLVP